MYLYVAGLGNSGWKFYSKDLFIIRVIFVDHGVCRNLWISQPIYPRFIGLDNGFICPFKSLSASDPVLVLLVLAPHT